MPCLESHTCTTTTNLVFQSPVLQPESFHATPRMRYIQLGEQPCPAASHSTAEFSEDGLSELRHLNIPLPPRAEVERLLVLPTPPPLPLTPLSSPLPHIPSPPLPVSPPLPISPPPLPTSPTHLLGYIAVMIWLRAEAPSTSHPLPLPPPSCTPPLGTPPLLPIPLPTPSPPLHLPSNVYRAGVSEVTLPPRKRLCIALGPRYEVSESLSAPTARPTGGLIADYGFIGTLDDEIRRDPERGRQDTYEIYGRLYDAQDDRLLMSGRLNMLHRDRRAHAQTARLIETEARLSREAWVQLMDVSDIDCSELRELQTIVLAQQTEIAGLRAADHTRQAQLVEILRLMSTLQTQVTALQRQ
ncbi:hypothetical protein Tco_0539884 [Tanacetum coccineum]